VAASKGLAAFLAVAAIDDSAPFALVQALFQTIVCKLPTCLAFNGNTEFFAQKKRG
jgi:hypothetical protein